ncbi:MAG: hypothetical protein AMJ75_02950 [Phycisphaerae bacterium SM1_79]|nr:MAG: hypothetical protein AMJ75_02950 [Phycisphaerae bacterium SM1_79]
MDFGLFFLGMLGAILTVYLAKQEVVPEFRLLFDTSDKEKEANRHRAHIKQTEDDIDGVQTQLKTPQLEETLAQRLMKVLESNQVELRDERTRLQTLEREIKQSQVFSRGIGFLLYIVLGGVFGSLLSGKVKVEGLSGDLPNFFEAIIIGATWTSYLSVIGSSRVSKKVDEKIEAARSEIVERANKRQKEASQQHKPEAAEAFSEMVMKITPEVFDMARMQVQRDVKGLL